MEAFEAELVQSPYSDKRSCWWWLWIITVFGYGSDEKEMRDREYLNLMISGGLLFVIQRVSPKFPNGRRLKSHLIFQEVAFIFNHWKHVVEAA